MPFPMTFHLKPRNVWVDILFPTKQRILTVKLVDEIKLVHKD